MITKPVKSVRRRLRRIQREGATAVEFAMVAPAFMIVVVVCVEFSRLSIMRNVSQNACYEAARYAMAEGAQIQDGIDRANEILSRLGNVEAEVFVNNSDGEPDDDGNVQNEMDFDTETVTVRVVISLKDNTLILPGDMFGDNTISSQVTLRTERYRGFFDASLVGD